MTSIASPGTERGLATRHHRIVSPDGTALHVIDAGPVDAPAAILIHGYSQNALAWRRQLEPPFAAQIRAVAIDLRGHGASDSPRDAYAEPERWAGDVAVVVDALRLERPVLVGWSYGGMVICDYLSTRGSDAVGGVVFVAGITKVGPPVMPFLGPEFVALVPSLSSAAIEEAVPALDAFLRLCSEEPASVEEHFLALGYNASVPSYVRTALFARDIDHDDLLRTLGLPVLVLQGDRDRIVLPTMADHIASLAPTATLSMYAGVGHAPFIEDRGRFDAEVGAFVLAHAGRGRNA